MFFIILLMAVHMIIGLAPQSSVLNKELPVFFSSAKVSSEILKILPQSDVSPEILYSTTTTNEFNASVDHSQGYPVFSLPFVHTDFKHNRTYLRLKVSGTSEEGVKANLEQHFRQKGLVFSEKQAPPYALLNKDFSRVVLLGLEKEGDNFWASLAFEEMQNNPKREVHLKPSSSKVYSYQEDLFKALKETSLPYKKVCIPNVNNPEQFSAFKYFFASSVAEFELSIKGKKEEMLKNIKSFLATLLLNKNTDLLVDLPEISWKGNRGTLFIFDAQTKEIRPGNIFIEIQEDTTGNIRVEIKNEDQVIKTLSFLPTVEETDSKETFFCKEKKFDPTTDALIKGLVENFKSHSEFGEVEKVDIVRIESTSPFQKTIDKRSDTLPSVFTLVPLVTKEGKDSQMVIRNAQPEGSVAQIRLTLKNSQNLSLDFLKRAGNLLKITSLEGQISSEQIAKLPLAAYIDKDTVSITRQTDGTDIITLSVYYDTLKYIGLKSFVDSLEKTEGDSLLEKIKALPDTLSFPSSQAPSSLKLSEIFSSHSPFTIINKSEVRTTETLDMVKGDKTGSWEVPRTSSLHYDTSVLSLVFDSSQTELTPKEALKELISQSEIPFFEVSDLGILTGRSSHMSSFPGAIYHVKEKNLNGTQILVVSMMVNRNFVTIEDDIQMNIEEYKAPQEPFANIPLPRIKTIIEELGTDITFFINASGGAIGFQSLRALINSGSHIVITMPGLEEKDQLITKLHSYLELILTSPTPSSARFIDYLHLTGHPYSKLDSQLFYKVGSEKELIFYMRTVAGTEVPVASYDTVKKEVLFTRTQTKITLIQEERKAEKIKWPWDQTQTPVILLDASGVFKSEEKLANHFSKPGSFNQPVLFMPTCPGEKNATTPNEQKISMSVVGALAAKEGNWVQENGQIKIFHSPASCTTNGITSSVNSLLKLAKIKGMKVLDINLLTLHAPTNSQETLVTPIVSTKSSIFASVPSTTGAVGSIGKFLNLKGVNVSGGANRLPQMTGSIGILDIIAEGNMSLQGYIHYLHTEQFLNLNPIEKTSELMKIEVDRNSLMDLNLTHFRSKGKDMIHMQIAVGYENEANFTEMMIHNALETIAVGIQLSKNNPEDKPLVEKGVTMNYPQMRSTLKTAKEERAKKEKGEESKLDKASVDISNMPIDLLKARNSVTRFERAGVKIQIQYCDEVISNEKKAGSEEKYQVIASNDVEGQEGDYLVTIKIDKALSDVAMLGGLSQVDYEHLLDYIVTNELIQANHRIDLGNPEYSDILLEVRKDLEYGSQVLALVMVSQTTGYSIEKTGELIENIIKASAEYYYEDQEGQTNQISSKKEEKDRFETVIEMAKALKEAWSKPTETVGLYKTLREVVKKDARLESQYIEASRNMHTLLSAA